MRIYVKSFKAPCDMPMSAGLNFTCFANLPASYPEKQILAGEVTDGHFLTKEEFSRACECILNDGTPFESMMS